MRKIFVFIVGLFIAGTVFAVGENVPTSKSYVDSAIAQKQDTIPANSGAAQVLTNTGAPGEYGTKNIYDSSAAYGTQTDSLVTAGAMNAAVQNAIESEFVCIERDAQGECLLLEIRGTNTTQSPNVLCTPTSVTSGGAFDVATGIITNTFSDTKNYLRFMANLYGSANLGNFVGSVRVESIYDPKTIKATFTAPEGAHYIFIKHNATEKDAGAFFPIEPSTTYTLIVHVLEVHPRVIGGIKLQVMMVRGEYDSDAFIPCGNIYLPQTN